MKNFNLRSTHNVLMMSFFLFFVFSITQSCAQKTNEKNVISDFTEDGAWCWFSDPRAIYIHGDKPLVISGWVKEDGSIEAGMLNLKDKSVSSSVLYEKLEKDDHDNPAFLELSDGNAMAFYAKHVNKYLYYNHINLKEDTADFGATVSFDPVSQEELAKFPRGSVTYANPYQLKDENNRIYCFGRWTGFKPNMMWSDDGGKTFTQSKVLIASKEWDPANRPYVKYFSDGRSRVHVVFTDGHPRVEDKNSVYYAYYEKGAFWKADGTKICTIDELPFTPDKATVVYKATEKSGRAWVYDVIADKKNKPSILYAKYPTEEEHQYYLASYQKGSWSNVKICDAGKWFPQTPSGQKEREPHYSGGLTFNPINHDEVYVSKEVNGVFEIVKYTSNKGLWKEEAVTSNSKFDNVRPYVPRNTKKGDDIVLLWMENEKYVHYTNYSSSIKYLINP